MQTNILQWAWLDSISRKFSPLWNSPQAVTPSFYFGWNTNVIYLFSQCWIFDNKLWLFPIIIPEKVIIITYSLVMRYFFKIIILKAFIMFKIKCAAVYSVCTLEVLSLCINSGSYECARVPQQNYKLFQFHLINKDIWLLNVKGPTPYTFPICIFYSWLCWSKLLRLIIKTKTSLDL